MTYASILRLLGIPEWQLWTGIFFIVLLLVAVFSVLAQRYSLGIALKAGTVFFACIAFFTICTVYFSWQALGTRYRAAEDQVKQEQLVQGVQALQQKGTNVVKPAADELDENIFFDTESLSKQELLKKLNYVESVLGTFLEEDDTNIQMVKSKFDAGALSDYDEMVQISKLEITKREHIVKAMDKKLDYVKGASFLKEGEQAELSQIFSARKYQAAQEKQDYQRILAEVQNHSAVYKNLGGQ